MTTHDGEDAAESGDLSHSQDSWIETSVVGPGFLSFWWKVSSQRNADALRFSIGGTELNRISGAVDWQQRRVSIPPGCQTIRWTYVKDGETDEGEDRGWLDEVAFTNQIRDQFLQELADANVLYFSPDGGENVIPGEGSPFRLNYWNVPPVLGPRQTIQSALAFTVAASGGPNSVVFKNALPEWLPNLPLRLEEGLQGFGRTVGREFKFTAPLAPGSYRLRLAMTWAFRGIEHFYGDGPKGDSLNPGVGPYSEITFQVQAPPDRDYFQEALADGGVLYFNPSGGENVIPGERSPFRIDYWNMPRVVAPGQMVKSALAYTVATSSNPNAVVHKTVLAEWSPSKPIAVIENGVLQGSPRTVRKDFTFAAPATPGVYRMRLAMTWAFRGIQNFYGDGPKGDSSNPGIGPYAEVLVRVEKPPRADYFLDQSAQNGSYYSPGGGEHDTSDMQRLDYWNLPEVVLPGQTVRSSLAYTVRGLNPNAVTFKSIHAEWQPDTPLVILENGELQGSARLVRKEFSFKAPEIPGVYRLRLGITYAFRGIQNFYGDGPVGPPSNPGVGPYSEVVLRVENPEIKLTPYAGYAAAYTFEEGTGAVALDAGILNRNADLVNGPAYSTDSAVGAFSLSFDGVDDRVDVPAQVPGEVPERTYEMWIKTKAKSGGLFRIDQWRGCCPGDYILLSSRGTLVGHYFNASDLFVAGTSPINDGQWHHVALSLSRTAGVKLFVDGVLEAANSAGAAPYSANHVTIGCENSGNEPNFVNFFKGQIDDFKVSVFAKTTIELPPVITVQPTSQQVTGGSNATLRVTAVGTPALRYQWRFNGANIPAATNTTFTLANAKITDSGRYSVAVTNTCGSATSETAILTVVSATNAAPTISVTPDQVIDEDTATTVSFTVDDAETAVDKLAVKAASSNELLVPNSLASLLLGGGGSNRTLSIAPLPNRFGKATITLTVSDESASASQAFVLTVNPVNDLPAISSIPSQTVPQNTPTPSISFIVGDVETQPNSLVVSGTSNDQRLVPNSSISIGGSGANRTVIVTPASNQTGTVVITIAVRDEDGGQVDSSFLLNVNAPASAPRITTHPASQTVKSGADVTFSVAATGTEPLQYRWRFNGTDIVGATNASLTIRNAQPSNAGIYSVVVSNAAGIAISREATLVVEAQRIIESVTVSLNSIVLRLRGPAGGSIVIETTASLSPPLSWSTVVTLQNQSGSVQFSAPLDSRLQSRFYRARLGQ
ncbi:MAG: immunoglobulin domain-containing protein [Verrucomicrobia bacterium]|nr:immunoglobulin domain-containing protein [Verrucomicrobiota bacterium]